jgi:DNA uptake protein ComE-like DNA-binding protein
MDTHRKKLPNITGRAIEALALCAALFWLMACNTQRPSDEQLKKQAEQTTQQVKKGAQEAAADAKVAAANAERKVNDIAAGVKDGLHDGKPAATQIDINAASANQLASLPGMNDARAKRIMRGRPYSTPHELVSKGVLTEDQFQQISGQITAQ